MSINLPKFSDLIGLQKKKKRKQNTPIHPSMIVDIGKKKIYKRLL
jgi:hypothetical protein